MSQNYKDTAMEVFDDLDEYREWCVEYGYVFNEKDLYRSNSNWSYFQRSRHGDRSVRNNWIRDSKRFLKENGYKKDK